MSNINWTAPDSPYPTLAIMNESTTSNPSSFDLGSTFGVLVLRVWLAVRAILSGLEKYGGTSTSTKPVTIDGAVNSYGLTDATSAKFYAFANYHGVPKPLYDKFLAEPLIPAEALKIYDQLLGPSLIALGVALLVGFATRFTLLAMGLLYTSLTVGLILINENSGVAWLAIHIALIALMLFQSKHNKLEITGRWKL
jgi:thiosulfate dehydrogenase (quinone) large subunit